MSRKEKLKQQAIIQFFMDLGHMQFQTTEILK